MVFLSKKNIYIYRKYCRTKNKKKKNAKEELYNCFKIQSIRSIKNKYISVLSKIQQFQAGNQEFFRAGEFSWNQAGHFNKHPPTTRERGLAGKNFWFFQPKTSKNFILNQNINFSNRWPIGHFFPKFGHFFLVFEKGQGRPPLHLPNNYKYL